MKRYILPGLIAMAFVSLDASAQCDQGTRVAQLQNLLPGNTVCATRDTDRWQEQHRVTTGFSGELWDYKKGPVDKVDPSKKLGTWSISSGQPPRTVTYTYDAFGPPSVSHTFEVYGPVGGTYNFCGVGNADNVTGATIKEGITSCP